MSNDGFDGGSSSHLAFYVFGHPTFLTGGIDLEAVGLRGVVALVSGIGDDARKRCPDLGLDGRNDGLKRVAIIGFSGQRLDVSDELAAFRSVDRRCDGDLDAELVGLMGRPALRFGSGRSWLEKLHWSFSPASPSPLTPCRYIRLPGRGG